MLAALCCVAAVVRSPDIDARLLRAAPADRAVLARDAWPQLIEGGVMAYIVMAHVVVAYVVVAYIFMAYIVMALRGMHGRS